MERLLYASATGQEKKFDHRLSWGTVTTKEGKISYISFLMILYVNHSLADPGFHRHGEGGNPSYILKRFTENCMNMKEIGTERRGTWP